MLKALLIVTAIGGADYSVEMPSMKECLNARTQIAEQDKTVKTLCVPKADETAKVQDFFNIFRGIRKINGKLRINSTSILLIIRI